MQPITKDRMPRIAAESVRFLMRSPYEPKRETPLVDVYVADAIKLYKEHRGRDLTSAEEALFNAVRDYLLLSPGETKMRHANNAVPRTVCSMVEKYVRRNADLLQITDVASEDTPAADNHGQIHIGANPYNGRGAARADYEYNWGGRRGSKGPGNEYSVAASVGPDLGDLVFPRCAADPEEGAILGELGISVKGRPFSRKTS